MNLTKTLLIAGGGWLAWEALKSVTGAVVKVQTAAAAKALPAMNLNPEDDYPGAVDASQGADVMVPGNLLPPIYGPMGPPTTDQLPIAMPVATSPSAPTYVYNPPDPPATIVATNPAAATPPSSSVLPSTTPVQSPTLPALTPTPAPTPVYVAPTPAPAPTPVYVAPTPTPAPTTTTTPTTTTPTPAPAPAPVYVSPYSSAAANRLVAGQALAAGSGIWSPNGRYLMHLVADGLLAFKEPKGSGTLWQSQTRDMGVIRAYMNPNGYFQLVKSNGAIVKQWGNGTPNSAIHVTDGRMILYSPTGQVIWSVS